MTSPERVNRMPPPTQATATQPTGEVGYTFSSTNQLYDSTDDERTTLLNNPGQCDINVLPGEGELPSQQAGSSWYASVFLVVNAALGAGLLNFPAAFDQSGGIVVAVTIQAILMIYIVGALVILAYCSDVNQSATYQDVVYSMCGKHAQTCCAVIVLVYAYGSCVTFFIVIGDQWDKFLTFAYDKDFCHKWYFNRHFTIISTCILLVLPLCFSRRIDFLKYTSFVGVFAVLYCVLLVTLKYFIGTNNPGPIATSPRHWTDVFQVVPVICFAYQKRTKGEFMKTVMVALGICIFAYTGTASFGYLTFGSDVNADILSSYDPTYDVLIAVILVAAKMYTTYPILLFVGRTALENVWLTVWNLPPDQVILHEKTRRIIMTLIWFVTSLALAVIVPDIGVVISILGGMAALFIFIFPGVCLLQVLLQGYVDVNKEWLKYKLLMVMAVGYLIIGTFILGVVTTQSIWNDIIKHQPKTLICH